MKVDDIGVIAVVGAGLMGHGIALEFALAGYEVHLHDLSEELLERATSTIRKNSQSFADRRQISEQRLNSILDGLKTSTALEDVARDADVVIEAIYENLEAKQNLFKQLDSICPPHTILASNSSTLLPSLLAKSTGRPDKVMIAHYFNPPFLLPLVELVRHPGTSDETVETMYELMVKVGKKPAIVQREIPGFIGNRLQAALFREALSLVENGIATPEDVDTVVKNGFGRRLAAAGPFEIWELVGWDLILTISQNLNPTLESSPNVADLLKEKVASGELGTKTGKGFYEWTPDSVESLRSRIGKTLQLLAELD